VDPRSVTAGGADVSFTVGADEYDRFMGRYSSLLAPAFATFAGVDAGQRVLDVGCGPGALTAELIKRAEEVHAVDPSERFVEALESRHPGVAVTRAAAEALPFEARRFDAALAQLVVHFMADPVAGIREMARVTREDGVVAACVWDHAGGGGPLAAFWEAARELDPGVHDESRLAGAREGHLAELFRAAGVREIEEGVVYAEVEHPTFEEWWEPFLLGVGPAGAYVAGLDPTRQARLRDLCRARLPREPFIVSARAWAARGRA
jgi:SAM-dependent methyltransferase